MRVALLGLRERSPPHGEAPLMVMLRLPSEVPTGTEKAVPTMR